MLDDVHASFIDREDDVLGILLLQAGTDRRIAYHAAQQLESIRPGGESQFDQRISVFQHRFSLLSRAG
jgi:hypothetical protein